MPSGPRIRTNNVFGTTTNNPLSAGGTTLNSAGLADLAAVSSAHAMIVLDPLRLAGAPEIVVVTAHTAAATSATITRGAAGTTAREHAAGTFWVHAPTIDDVIRICTSSTRPSDPYEGQAIFETDTDALKLYSGSAWEQGLTIGAWTSYTPTLTQNGAVPKTTNYARYMKVGRTVHVAGVLTVSGAGGSAANAVKVGLPVNNVGVANIMFGVGQIYDASANAAYRAIMQYDTASSFFLVPAASTVADVLGVTSFTAALAAGDIIQFCGTLEAAS